MMSETFSVEPLAQLLQSIMSQERTGVVRVEQIGEREPQRGEMYFEQGYLMRVQVGQETGSTALHHIGAWERITCSFYSMSRPFPLMTGTLLPSSEPQTDKRAAARPAEKQQVAMHQLSTVRGPEPEMTRGPGQEANHSSHVVEAGVTGEQRKIKGQVSLVPGAPSLAMRHLATAQRPASQPSFASSESGTRRATQQTDGMTIVNIRASLSTMQQDQPLVLRGDTLETYTPEQQVKPSPTVKRWTTHVAPPAILTGKPPITPRLSPLPGEEGRPTRTATFKAKAMTATSQAIQHMERHERIVFILLDGRRTVQDIARLTHQLESEVEEVVVRLAKDGYIYYIRE